MGQARQDLTGQWWGDYAYPGQAGPKTPFIARIEDREGHFTGTIMEPDMFGTGFVEATLTGHRRGGAVDFVKVYGARAPVGYDRPVDYVGRLSDDGLMIRGVLSLLDLDGTFEMHREIEAGDMQEQKEVVALTISDPQ